MIIIKEATNLLSGCLVKHRSQNSGDEVRGVHDQISLENAVDSISFLDIPNMHEPINSSGRS